MSTLRSCAKAPIIMNSHVPFNLSSMHYSSALEYKARCSEPLLSRRCMLCEPFSTIPVAMNPHAARRSAACPPFGCTAQQPLYAALRWKYSMYVCMLQHALQQRGLFLLFKFYNTTTGKVALQHVLAPLNRSIAHHSTTPTTGIPYGLCMCTGTCQSSFSDNGIDIRPRACIRVQSKRRPPYTFCGCSLS